MMCESSRRGGVGHTIGKVILGVIAAAAFALVIGALAMVLWNWVMVDVFSLPEIGYWQAFGIVLLAKLLFGFGSFGHGEKHEDSKKTIRGEIRNEIRSEICKEMKKEMGEEVRKGMHRHFGTNRFDDMYEAWWEKEGAECFKQYMKQQDTREEKE